MKVTVFGAVGATGQQVVNALLERGADVTAFFRPPAEMPETSRPVRVVRANPSDAAAVRSAVAGADAVICTAGCIGEMPSSGVSFALRAVLDMMCEVGVRRLVAVSATPAAPAHHASWFQHYIVHPFRRRDHADQYADLQRMEAMLAQSECDWTVVRPARVVDGDTTGEYLVAVDSKLPHSRAISRGDLASALVDITNDDAFVGHFVTIA